MLLVDQIVLLQMMEANTDSKISELGSRIDEYDRKLDQLLDEFK